MKKYLLVFLSALVLSCTADNNDAAKNNQNSELVPNSDWQITVTKAREIMYKGHTKEVVSDKIDDFPNNTVIKWSAEEQMLTLWLEGKESADLAPDGKIINGKLVSIDAGNGDILTYDFSEIKNNKLIRTTYDQGVKDSNGATVGDNDYYAEFY